MNNRLTNFYKEYRNLSPEKENFIYDRFLDDIHGVCSQISGLFFVGIILLTYLDFSSGFYNDNPINILNFYAELIVIISSGICFLQTFILKSKKNISQRKSHTYKQILVIFYKICLLSAIILFITTDVKARGVFLGTYLIYFFLLLIMPFYRSWENFLFFCIPGLYLGYLYFDTVGTKWNLMLGELSIFLAFFFVSEYIRIYFIRQTMYNQKIESDNERIQRLVEQIISALSGAVEIKDEYTQGHSRRVAKYSRMIAQNSGYSEEDADKVYYIALLHDVGKIGIDDSIINSTTKLTDEEYAIMKSHPVNGYNILKQITEFPELYQGARWHHERYDGKGYPDGLSGKDIPEIARIIAVADSYDAMTSNRSYRNIMPQEKVREEIESNIGKQFDPDFARVMLKIIDEDRDFLLHES